MEDDVSNFVKVGDSSYVINLERVAYVDDRRDEGGEIFIHFTAYDPDIEELTCVRMEGDNATRFMTMLDRQIGVW